LRSFFDGSYNTKETADSMPTTSTNITATNIGKEVDPLSIFHNYKMMCLTTATHNMDRLRLGWGG